MTHSDSQTGTPVTLVVRPAAPTTPGHTAPPPSHGPSHLPFSGFELVPVLGVAAVLMAAGAVLSAVRRSVPVRARSSSRQ